MWPMQRRLPLLCPALCSSGCPRWTGVCAADVRASAPRRTGQSLRGSGPGDSHPARPWTSSITPKIKGHSALERYWNSPESDCRSGEARNGSESMLTDAAPSGCWRVNASQCATPAWRPGRTERSERNIASPVRPGCHAARHMILVDRIAAYGERRIDGQSHHRGAD